MISTPAELYENPNSLFVAGFIGSPKMNFLTGKIAKAQGCATLGVRFEHIDLGGDGTWRGEVVHAEDPGSDNCLFGEIGSNEPVILRQAEKSKVPVGEKLALSPNRMHKFNADGKPIR